MSREPGPPRVTIEGGVLHVDGAPRYFLNTDYPYYRDEVKNWRSRLEAQAECGLDVLTCYVPWRHHAPVDPIHEGGQYDFTGATQANRDLVGLLGLAEELGLMVILKPGPFVHAELPFGGLPSYVCGECNPTSGIQPEIDAFGEPIRWRIGRMRPQDARVLPAPFDPAYNVYVRSWFRAFAREVAAPRFWPKGPVIALQLLNEGIYSDSSRADPTQFAFAPSTLVRFRRFLKDRYGDVAAYNDLHGSRVEDWDEIEPPRNPSALRSVRDLLAYLDWSAFQGRIYADVAALYKSYLEEGGVPREAPILFNFNPNGNTYKQNPASNDGWYTRVNLVGRKGFTFGLTNWLGVVAGDSRAFRQYVMANTAFRGPAMEMNWGFASEYYTPYQHVAPSVYEAMVAVACGATGVTAYTFAGTRAWRDDPNVDVQWIPQRTNAREDASSADYPGDSPVLSTGERTGKYWSLMQIAQYLRDEGPRFLAGGPRASLAWGIYPPYAWAGQWLMRGDPDDYIWKPPLKAVPRGAYHGLDAFAEMALGQGVGFRQVDVSRDLDLGGCRLLCVSAHEYMDLATQERLARYVHRGGRLLLTNVVPDRDETLRPARGALHDLFPHGEHCLRPLAGPTPLVVEGEEMGAILEYVHTVTPPADADLPIRINGDLVGYRRRHGAGTAIFLGASPWRATLSGDDRHVSQENQRLAWRLLLALGDAEAVRTPRGGKGAVVFEHGQGADPRDADLFVIVGETGGDIAVRRSPDGREETLLVRSPSLAAHAVALDASGIRACYLKGITDTRGERVAPRLSAASDVLEADDPCDLCVTRTGEGLRVSVAHLGKAATRVRLPLDPALVAQAEDGRGEPLRMRPAPEGGLEVVVPAIERAGIATLRLRATARTPQKSLR